jgi:hypothetical protein
LKRCHGFLHCFLTFANCTPTLRRPAFSYSEYTTAACPCSRTLLLPFP